MVVTGIIFMLEVTLIVFYEYHFKSRISVVGNLRKNKWYVTHENDIQQRNFIVGYPLLYIKISL